MTRLTVTDLISRHKVHIKDVSKGLHIKTKMANEHLVHIKVYNPNGLLVGEIVHGHYTYPRELHIGENVSINGLEHQVMTGDYIFEVITMDPSIQWPLMIDIMYDFSLDQGTVYQEETWFGEEGIALDYGQIINGDERFYKGDFHGHTSMSDGELTVSEALKVVEERLDFMTITDHNRMAFGYPKSNALLVPSFELTLFEGHINIHGIVKHDLFADTFEQVLRPDDLLIQGVLRHREYCNISLNHMFLDQWSFVKKDFDINHVNTIEIICDPTYPTSYLADQKTVRFMDYLWNKGHKVYAVGGSDSHNAIGKFYDGTEEQSIYGDPATYIFCKGLSVDNIINGAKNGRSYVSRYVQVDLSYVPGLCGQVRDSYQVKVNGLCSEKYTLKFILNGDTIHEKKISKDDNKVELINLNQRVENLDYWWMRLGIYDELGNIVAFVNPLHKGEKTPDIHMVDQLIEEFNRQDD